MGSGTLTLDTILSATEHFSAEWSRGLESNKAFRVLRFLIIRLYDEGRGSLVNTSVTLAQTTLARKLNLSRQWVGELVLRLGEKGWIEHYSPKLADGMNGSTNFRIGRQLKRLLVMLLKSKQQKTPTKPPAKSTWHFSPTYVEKKIFSLLEKEKVPPSESVCRKIPLLNLWMGRRKEKG